MTLSIKYDIPNSLIPSYIRYYDLFLKGDSRTSAENTEFDGLETTLEIYKMKATDWNALVQAIEDLTVYVENYADILNLLLTNQSEGTTVKVDWTNPSSHNFIAREIYVSTTNISNTNRAYCNTNATLLNGTIGTGSANADTLNYSSTVGVTYYFKIFSVYELSGVTYYSDGVASSILTSDTTPPNNVTSFNASAENTQIKLSWTDPTNADWAGTKIMRKTGSYPANQDDGTLVVNSTASDQYSVIPYTDTGLTNGTEYFYQAFPYDTNGNYNTNVANRASATPLAYVTYGVRIDTTNINPETALTYTDDAIGMTGGSSTWDTKFPFNLIKPCLLKAGFVQYYLSPTDYTKKADGVTASDITSGNDGDVMIEIPKTAYMIYTEGNYIYVKVTDNPNAKSVDSRYCFYGHTRVTEGDKNNLYIGAYLGYNLSSKLRSLSGKTPTATQTIGAFRTLAQANGTGYDQVGFYPLTLLQCLYTIRYKHLNSQIALGRGYVDGNSAAIATGGTNAKSMYFGETTGKLQMKFMGIEDFWGNLRWWIDGLYSNATRNILTAFQSFNDTGSGYTDRGQGATADIVNYMSKPQGTTEKGFIAKEVTGSETTYFSDYALLYASYLPYFGGDWGYASNAGAFCLVVNYSAASSSSSLGSRLMFL